MKKVWEMTMNGFSNIKQQSGKKFLFIFCLSIIVLLLTSCPALSDWLYELPNDYAISSNAYTTIDLAKIKSRYGDSCTLDIVVETYIDEFAYSERYIAVKQFDPEKLDFENFNSNDFSAPLYYIVDTVSTNVYGPYETKEMFETACAELDVGNLGNWICTRNNPNKK